MDVAVLGLGYVGCVSAAALAAQGHRVRAVDVDESKVDLVASGRSPIVEAGVDQLLERVVSNGSLTAHLEAGPAVAASQVSLVCVGTPSTRSGELDLTFVRQVCREIGQTLRDLDDRHTVAIRSTLQPGTITSTVVPDLEAASGRVAGEHLGVCVNPEFLREGSALSDYHDPPFTLIGADDDRAAADVAALYEQLEAPVVRTSLGAAEMVKYASNAFHALKVTFANEIGVLCKRLGIDSHEVMDVFVRDRKLNISPTYLRPGMSFGGSCLPKDLRSLVAGARSLHLDLPVLSSILPSNQRHLDHVFELVEGIDARRVGLLGLSFKAGTDDLRESPMVALAERLIGKGYDLRIHDRNVSLARLRGANKRYIEQTIPHISSLLVERLEDLVGHAEILIVGVKDPESERLAELVREDQHVIDLVRMDLDPARMPAGYEGIGW